MSKRLNAGAMRVRGFLEIASALYDSSLANLGVQLTLMIAKPPRAKREVGVSFATGGTVVLERVTRKKVDVGWVNPAAALAMAVRGKGIFTKPAPLRKLANFLSWDRMVFAVSEKSGISSLSEVRERQIPLHVSMTGTTPVRDNLCFIMVWKFFALTV